jgi:hypothetical protein
MQLKPLYRVEFFYTDEWGVNIEGSDGTERQHFFLSEGDCTGILTGRFVGQIIAAAVSTMCPRSSQAQC